MQTTEITIWAAMLGGLLMLTVPVILDVLQRGRAGAWRELSLLLVFGAGAVLLTGLPEHLLGISDERLLLPLKAGLGPLAGGLRLLYLAGWLGTVLRSNGLRSAVIGSAVLLLAAGFGFALWALIDTHREADRILYASAIVSLFATAMGWAVIAVLAAARGAVWHDPLVRAMVVAGVAGVGMVVGLYAKALQVNGLDHRFWVFTALCTLTYLFIVTFIAMERAKAERRLRRMARGANSTDAVTGLLTGVALLAQVDHALWRSVRASRETAVIAVWVNNLYELSGTAGQHVDQEIQSRMTKRLRQAAGFRNVVGLYHSRCFLVVMSTVKHEREVRAMAQRLRVQLQRTTLVGSLSEKDHIFTPQVGIGIVRVPASSAEPTAAMDDAEALAQSARTTDGGVAIRVLGRMHVTPLAQYNFQADDQHAPPTSPMGLTANSTA
jgi:GGDEF domain-containing protein